MVNVILGKSKTGKTTHIYYNIDEDIKNKKNVILFVPSQARAKAESEYMNILKKDGVIGVDITTITEYISSNMKKQNIHHDEKYLSKLDRKIIVSKIVNDNQNLFKFFKKSIKYSGFIDILTIYMDIFRKSEISVNDYRKISFEDKKTDIKFKELVDVFEKYGEIIRSDYTDSVEEVELFVKNIKNKDILKNKTIYFDGYNNFTNQEYKFIDLLMSLNIDITISLNTDITKIEDIYNSQSIFEGSNQTYKRICAIADKNNIALENIIKLDILSNSKDDIKFLEENLFGEKNIEKIKLKNVDVNIYTNILKESEKIARIIKDKVMEGYNYSDFVIYTTEIEEYEKIMSRVFYENGLSLYSSKSKSIEESVLTKYITYLLYLAQRGISLEIIFDILKLGITDIPLEDIYDLENYIKEFEVNEYLVNRDFILNTDNEKYDLEKLNRVKRIIVNMYDFIKTMNDLTAKEYVEKIYEHLNENNIFDHYDFLIDIKEKDSINMNIIDFEEQVWESISEIFNSIIKIYGDRKLKIEELYRLFKLVIKDTKIKTLPPSKDQIELIDIDVSKVEAKKQIFFVGVTENKFPKKSDQDIFFHDLELEKIKEKEIELKETTISKLNMGLFNIYEAISNAIEHLYITIPSATLDGKATRKSSLINLMSQISEFETYGEVTKEDTDVYNITSKDKLFEWLISETKNIDNLEDIDKLNKIITVYDYFNNDEEYKKILHFKKDDSNLSNEMIDRLYSNRFESSITKLELYKKCPFSYYLQYILKLKPRQEVQLNRLELGSFMHAVLEKFSKYLFNNNIRWTKIIDINEGYEIYSNYKTILEGIVEEEIEHGLRKQKQNVRYEMLKSKLINTMNKVISVVAQSFNQSEFEPFGYEIEFKDGKMFAPIEIELSNNRKMILTGKIDRVDVLKTEDEIYARVIDYKSSSKDLKIDAIKEGLSLQLISYLNAFIENNKSNTIKPSAMLYFNLSDKLVSLAQYESDNEKIQKKVIDALRMKGIFINDIEILNKMDRHFEDDKRLIGISKRGMSNALPISEFESLCKEANIILKNIGDDITKGIVKIKPNKKSDHCKYCNYISVCRKNSCI